MKGSPAVANVRQAVVATGAALTSAKGASDESAGECWEPLAEADTRRADPEATAEQRAIPDLHAFRR